jgi:hypothetical protein
VCSPADFANCRLFSDNVCVKGVVFYMDVNLGTGVLSRCASLMIMIGCAIVGQAPREPSTQVAQGPCDQAEQKPMLCHQCYHFLPFQRVRQHVCHPYSGIIISHIPADG